MWAKIELALKQHLLKPSLDHFVVADRRFDNDEGEDKLWVWDRKLFTEVTFGISDVQENTLDESDNVDRWGWEYKLEKLT